MKNRLLFLGFLTGIFLVYVVVFGYQVSLKNNTPEKISKTFQKNDLVNSVLGIFEVPAHQKETAFVLRVIDGDTIELSTGEKVRYIGIDSPETKDPRRPVGCFGKEAYLRNKDLVEGKTVVMEVDVSQKDKYSRLLRYVYINGVFVNKLLAEEGYARASTYPPDVKYQKILREAEKTARINNKGLWKICSY